MLPWTGRRCTRPTRSTTPPATGSATTHPRRRRWCAAGGGVLHRRVRHRDRALPTETGKSYVGEALELRHRLPRTWARVCRATCRPGGPADRAAHHRPVPRSRRLRRRHVAAFAHKIRPTALDRTIDTAIARTCPTKPRPASRQPPTAAGSTSTPATRPDRHRRRPRHPRPRRRIDLEAAVADVAATLKDLGSEDSLDVRRAVAVGEIARRQLALDLTGDDGPGSIDPTPTGCPLSCCTSTSPTPRSPAPAGSATSTRSTSPSSASRSTTWCGGGAGTRQTRDRPGPVRTGRRLRHPRSWPTRPPSATATAPSPGAPAPPALRHRPRAPPRTPASPPAPATSQPCAGATTASRPTDTGDT